MLKFLLQLLHYKMYFYVIYYGLKIYISLKYLTSISYEILKTKKYNVTKIFLRKIAFWFFIFGQSSVVIYFLEKKSLTIPKYDLNQGKVKLYIMFWCNCLKIYYLSQNWLTKVLEIILLEKNWMKWNYIWF